MNNRVLRFLTLPVSLMSQAEKWSAYLLCSTEHGPIRIEAQGNNLPSHHPEENSQKDVSERNAKSLQGG